MARILLTGGRAPVALDLARHFAEGGHEVFVAESQATQISRFSRAVRRTFRVPPPRQDPAGYQSRLVEIARDHAIEHLIPTCEEVFYVARARERFPTTCKVWVDSFKTLSALHDKFEFSELGPRLGLNTPASHLVRSASDLRAIETSGEKWVLKPTFSRFGHRVLLGTLGELIASAPDFAGSWVLQEFIAGPEFCAYAVADRGRVTALSIYAHEFVAGRAGITFEETDQPEIEAAIRRFAGHLEFTGQLAFDFIVRNGEAFALECNPRATSGVHLLTAREDFREAFLKPGGEMVRAEIGSRAKLGLAMLAFGLSQVTSWRKLVAWTKLFFGAREVLLSWRDPLPFFDQLYCVGYLGWVGFKNKMDLLSASTADIEWNGEP